MRDAMAVFICEINRVHHLAINVQLELLVSCISDAYRLRILIPTEMIQRNLVELLPAIEPIHHLQWTRLGIVTQSSFEPLNECFRFVDKSQSNEGIQRESRVSQPGEAVIPIAHASYPLW